MQVCLFLKPRHYPSTLVSSTTSLYLNENSSTNGDSSSSKQTSPGPWADSTLRAPQQGVPDMEQPGQLSFRPAHPPPVLGSGPGQVTTFVKGTAGSTQRQLLYCSPCPQSSAFLPNGQFVCKNSRSICVLWADKGP